MQALDKDLRSALEKTVKAARKVAETAAHAAAEQLGVGHDKPEAFLSDAEKALRNRLRTHGKQLGDARDSKSTNPTYGKQEVRHLVQEVAYQHWHRMLFARFLADNDLLMYDGVAVTLEECEELASDEGAKNGWALAGRLAARMLPQIFKPGSPVFDLAFAPEHQSELERLLKDLPNAVFKASDSLGWVYQFWQADNKERINKSEVKIGADELPAVTQLFTEPYMVAFLLHNSLGAWWATRHPGKPCPVTLDYFRPQDAGTPAAGRVEEWPDSLAEFKLLDPCCGSGHFLVAAFLMLVPMRMAAEGLSAGEAVDCVLAENIHGLELDPRCVEIAVFAVALEAWRYPDESGRLLGVREIPALKIACCGLKVAARAQDWEALVPDEAPNAQYMRQELRQLHMNFSNAPVLGSLLDPARSLKDDLATSNYETLIALLSKALDAERPQKQTDEDNDHWELAIGAQGLLEAARLLTGKYHLVITNVPYSAGLNLDDTLRGYIEDHYASGKANLATVFLLRCAELGLKDGGVVNLVLPQDWLVQPSYSNFRRHVALNSTINYIFRLGPGAFREITGEVVNVILLGFTNGHPEADHSYLALDCGRESNYLEKIELIRTGMFRGISQARVLGNPSFSIFLTERTEGAAFLGQLASSVQGIKSGDDERLTRFFWEVNQNESRWISLQSSIRSTRLFGGLERVVDWSEDGALLARKQGLRAWGKRGVVVGQMSALPCTLYAGGAFDSNVTVIFPRANEDAAPLLEFAFSGEMSRLVREFDQSIKPTNSSFEKVVFSKQDWTRGATFRIKEPFPLPYSDDPTQRIFHGHPQRSSNPLQVAVARLVGYKWPAESDDKMELSEEARAWVQKTRELTNHADNDGIVCIPPVAREASAVDRLLNLLADAYGDAWSGDVLAQFLTAADHAGKSLETWLREKFFTQHCALFGNRPFVWHIWDGLRDGFAALVNYHKLDYKTLESLIYTYLGDWIGRQKRDAERDVDGAQEKLAAAEALKKHLESILAGEAPYDIFVRWKPFEEQPIGWNPDPNDGVGLNIRPFLSVPDVGKKGAGVLRDRPKSLDWKKDRGSDLVSAPWSELGLQYGGKLGDRINDHHLSLDEKHKAREITK
ncbi:SAM-dependent DNA methyltransferase [Paraburkholderia metrosideri]|uniref:site-specific DNA-methyltransferase (adenine-specific) n=1 Tax=Paraburkholderia metrosideri TaxID=580937 RepID=A0ABW9E3L5_9BURK